LQDCAERGRIVYVADKVTLAIEVVQPPCRACRTCQGTSMNAAITSLSAPLRGGSKSSNAHPISRNCPVASEARELANAIILSGWQVRSARTSLFESRWRVPTLRCHRFRAAMPEPADS